MRRIIFDGHDYEDPVHIGEIFEIVRGDERHIVQAVPEKGMGSCAGCVFFNRACSAPDARGSLMHLCSYTDCVFKPISDIMEEI